MRPDRRSFAPSVQICQNETHISLKKIILNTLNRQLNIVLEQKIVISPFSFQELEQYNSCTNDFLLRGIVLYEQGKLRI